MGCFLWVRNNQKDGRLRKTLTKSKIDKKSCQDVKINANKEWVKKVEKKITKYFAGIILVIIVISIINFNNKINRESENNIEVSIITIDEYRHYVKSYEGSLTADYLEDEFIKIKYMETRDGIVYNYGIIFPYYIWKDGRFDEIQKHAVYFAEDYSSIFNKYDLSVAVGTVNIEPNNVFRIGLRIQNINLNKLINPEGIINLDDFSFRFTPDMIDIILKNKID
ncbi:MAG TPA: hypothetical protein DHU59_02260 [Clostridiales bacterium]|nr:hypothetical protein [Clostridiales bacterium]